MKKPMESEYNSYAAYTRALEIYCDDDDTQTYKKPWVGLTDEEIDKKYWAMPRIDKPQPTQFEFARAIEQALKDKNT